MSNLVYNYEMMSRLRDTLNGYFETAINAITSTDKTSIAYAIKEGLKYWYNGGEIAFFHMMNYASKAGDDGMTESCATISELAYRQFVQMGSFINKCCQWFTNDPEAPLTSTAKTALTNIDYQMYIYDGQTNNDTVASYVTQLLYPYEVETPVIPSLAESENINICYTLMTEGKRLVDGGIQASINDVFNLRASDLNSNINSTYGIQNDYSSSIKLSSRNEINADLSKFNTYYGRASTALQILKTSTISTADDVFVTQYRNAINYIASAKRYLDILAEYCEKEYDTTGYNYVEYSDGNTTNNELYVIGMSLGDSTEYVRANAYLITAKTLLESAIERYGSCIDLLTYSSDIRRNAILTNIQTSINTTNNNLTELANTVSSNEQSMNDISGLLNTTRNTLASLITAHNKGIQMTVNETMSDTVLNDPTADANIDDFINIIRRNIYGKDIRNAIADALDVLQNRTNLKRLIGKSCTYEEWISAGSPADQYTLYFVYDEKMIIYRGVRYAMSVTYETSTNNGVGNTGDINSGINWYGLNSSDTDLTNVESDVYDYDYMT